EAKPNVVLLRSSSAVSPAARSRLNSCCPEGPPAILSSITKYVANSNAKMIASLISESQKPNAFSSYFRASETGKRAVSIVVEAPAFTSSPPQGCLLRNRGHRPFHFAALSLIGRTAPPQWPSPLLQAGRTPFGHQRRE